MTLSESETSTPLSALARAGGVMAKWMTEEGEPACGLTLSPVVLPGGVAVADPVVVAAGVLGVVAVGGAAPGPLVAAVVVFELCAQPARPRASAAMTRSGLTSLGAVHE